MDHSQITIIEDIDMNESLVCSDDVVDLEKDNDEFGEDYMTKYDIQAGTWLANMYASRHYWAKAYLKDTFFAGMTTSGRSESINAFFDGYINSNTMLNDFVTQYDKAIKSRRDAEEDEDFKTRNTKASLESDHPIEEIAGERYTRKLFEIFKNEWKAAIFDYFHEKISMDENIIKYRVGSRKVDKEWWAIVEYHLTESFTAHCSCAKFETMGILCKHILYIMKKKQIMTIPEKYILPRWTMNASYKEQNLVGFQSKTTTNEVSALSPWSVYFKLNMAFSEARDSISELKRLDTLAVEFIQQQLERKRERTEEEQNSQPIHSQITLDVCDPIHPIKTKGRPKGVSRIKSSLELSTKTQKTCRYYGGKGQD